MAARLRYSIIAAAMGCLGIATALLPIDVRDRDRTRIWGYATQLRWSLYQANNLLIQSRLSDSLSRVLATGILDQSPIVFGFSALTTVAQRSSTREDTAQELDELGALATEIPVGIFIVDENFGSHAGYPFRPYWIKRNNIQLGPTGPYCIISIRADNWDRARRSTSLGSCSFYLKFGVPGQRIQEWLFRRGHRFAESLSLEHLLSHLDPGQADRLQRRRSEQLPFGLRPRYSFGFGNSPSPVEVNACRSGDEHRCLTIFAAPFASEQTSRLPELADGMAIHTPLEFRFYEHDFHAYSASLLGDLLREFGEDAVQIFWKSPLEVEDAFEETFGIPAGRWMMTWTRERLGPLPRGPTMSLATISLSIFIITMLTAAGAGTARRRISL